MAVPLAGKKSFLSVVLVYQVFCGCGYSMHSAMGDFHELKLEFRRVWGPVLPTSNSSNFGAASSAGSSGCDYSNKHDRDSLVSPGPRFCHVGVVYDGSFYIFGGYDGAKRLNDFLRYRFASAESPLQGPVSCDENPSSVADENRRNQLVSSGWEMIMPLAGSVVPSARSLHAGAVWKDYFLVFGGYDGQRRVNDLYSFSFKQNLWQQLSNVEAPTPRDRHVAVVYDNYLYIFGGFDGLARVNGNKIIADCVTLRLFTLDCLQIFTPMTWKVTCGDLFSLRREIPQHHGILMQQ